MNPEGRSKLSDLFQFSGWWFWPGADALLRHAGAVSRPAAGEAELIAAVEGGRDHLDPEELADRLIRGEPNLLVVDIRPAGEDQAFHIRRAVNIPLEQTGRGTGAA